jgi:hypothetical protein
MAKRLNLRELLNFYDYTVESSNTHASAVNAVLGEDLAVAFLLHYFKSLGYGVLALDQACTQGTKKGSRLDKWIAVQSASESVIYQVEIKNWSAHSIGGNVVERPDDPDYMREFRVKRWNYQFDAMKKVPSQAGALKVLTKMRVPDQYSNTHSQQPLLCFWEPLHQHGDSEALFEVEVVSEAFTQLKVFSMSNYVSLLLKTSETLEVEMPDADARIDWMQKLYR